jgi:hypothetical protein
MVGVNDDPIVHPAAAARTARVSVNTRWLLGTLLFLIGIAAIVGIVVTTAIGQPTVALIIALFAAAFFSRVAC